MSVIEKNIPLTAFEREMAEKNSGSSLLVKMPLPVMRWFVLRNIESYRNPEDFVMPVMPACGHEIEYERREMEGAPKPVGVSVYFRKADAGKKRPLLFFIHGGGFMGGDSRVSEGLMRWLADKLGIVAASVDYNVAPEVKHPVPLEDCYRAFRYVLAHYPVKEDEMFFAGDSAGGNLAAVMTLKLLAETDLVPRGQILFYPVTNLDSVDSESYREKGPEYAMMCKGIKLSQMVYLPDKASRKHPYVSPAYAQMEKPQPDALLLVAERDGLRSDGTTYAQKLEEAGGYARCIVYKGAFHSFINDLFRSDIADDAAQEMLAFMKERISGHNG